MLATVDAVASAGIPVMLQYAHVEDPEDPAEDEDLWGGVGTIYREVVAQAESSGLKLANHGRWPTPDAAARARAAEQGISYEDYRRFRVPEWEGPFMIRDGDHIARLVEQEAPSPNHGVCMCAGMGMNGTDVLEAVDRFPGQDLLRPAQRPEWHVAAGRRGNAGRGRHRREGVSAKAPRRRLHRPRKSRAFRGHQTSQRRPRGRRHRHNPGLDKRGHRRSGLGPCACTSAEETRSESRRNSGRQRRRTIHVPTAPFVAGAKNYPFSATALFFG